MKITTRAQDDVSILDLQGNLTHGKADVALRQHIFEALDQGKAIRTFAQ